MRKPLSGGRLVVTLVCVFMAVLILIGGSFGIAMAVRNSSYVMSYGNIGIDEGTATYLATYYKAIYIKRLNSGGTTVSDTEAFWGQTVINDTTLGDYLSSATEGYIKQVLAANYLFNKYTRLSSEDKLDLKLAVEEKLDYIADGSVSKFNEMTEQYGFDYDDFRRGTELLYKSWAAKTKIFGENGENMLSFTEACEEYYKSYSHVKLLFVRTEDEFVLDDKGNRVPDGDGNDSLRQLTEEEKAQRLERIEYIKGVVDSINAGKASAEMFDQLLADYDEGDRGSHAKGYYFNKNAVYTSKFAEDVSEEVVRLSGELEIGELGYVDCSFGVCFAYRIPRDRAAYTDTSEEWCFSDFFADAAVEMFQEMLDEIAEEITPRDGFYNINPVTLKPNTDFVARF